MLEFIAVKLAEMKLALLKAMSFHLKTTINTPLELAP